MFTWNCCLTYFPYTCIPTLHEEKSVRLLPSRLALFYEEFSVSEESL